MTLYLLLTTAELTKNRCTARITHPEEELGQNTSHEKYEFIPEHLNDNKKNKIDKSSHDALLHFQLNKCSRE